MSFLATSDFQCEWSNLDLCEQAWQECLDICKKRHIKTIAYLGDGKQSYNPVDIRVIHWWQNAIHKANKLGIEVLFVKGNHDRVGQAEHSETWLPILKKAGAKVFEEPAVVSLGEGRLFILPYSGTMEAVKNATKFLKSKPNRKKDILLFHHDIKGINYNRQRSKSDASLSDTDIFSSKYRYCIGGHVHFPQRFGQNNNSYYVGSPFCHDWGEVNQRKRYLVIGSSSITSVNSKIPRWFDPSVPGFYRAAPVSGRYNGARIRIGVLCEASEDYGRRLEKVRRKAERKYKGAIIEVRPKFRDVSEQGISRISTTDSDERKIKEYIGQTRVQEHVSKSVALDYMLEKLSHFSGGLRTGSRVKFISAKGKNFLPFKKVKMDFTQKGITVIQGINYDRNRKSNGSGKTSFIQLIPVTVFGKTFKGQSHDAWATRGSKGIAKVETALRDYKERTVVIKRGRRPPLLRMLVEGRDVSSGMKSSDKNGTQTQIEQVTGFTWQTLANAVYIDRRISDAFLSGTKKERTDVLSRFQNLERFSKALDLVKKDERKNREALLQAGETLSRIRGSYEECRESLHNLDAISKVQSDDAYKEYETRSKALKKWRKENKVKFKKLEHKAIQLKKKYDKELNRLRIKEKQLAILQSDLDRIEKEALRIYKLKKKRKCPTCYQNVSKNWITKESHRVDKLYSNTDRVYKHIRYKIATLRKNVQLLDGEYTETQRHIGKLDNELHMLEGAKRTAQHQWMELSSETHSSKNIIGKTRKKLKELVKTKQSLKHKIKKYKRLNALYEYAMEAFSRNGIPAFLNRQLCPVLNKAADYYAELFSDKEIQLRFEVEEGEFVPKIINDKGGAEIDDQSEGERALAGLIASFALREVAPKCNILILDEPGNGLDEQTARQFARALQELKKRFGSIWITSHNQAILSELSGERTITVIKKNKLSKIIQGEERERA